MGHWGFLPPGFHRCPALWGQRTPSVFVIAFLIHLRVILTDFFAVVKREFFSFRCFGACLIKNNAGFMGGERAGGDTGPYKIGASIGADVLIDLL